MFHFYWGPFTFWTPPTHIFRGFRTPLEIDAPANDAAHVIQPGVIPCNKNLSDQYVIFCDVIGYNTALPQGKNYVIRDKFNFNAELYCDELSIAITSFFIEQKRIN